MRASNWLNFVVRRLGLKPKEQEESSVYADPEIWNFWSLPEKAVPGQELRTLVEAPL